MVQTYGGLSEPTYDDVLLATEANKVINYRNLGSTPLDASVHASIVNNMMGRYKCLFTHSTRPDDKFRLGLRMDAEMVSGSLDESSEAVPRVSIVYDQPVHGLRRVTDIYSVELGVPIYILEAYATLVRKAVSWKTGEIDFNSVVLDDFRRDML